MPFSVRSAERGDVVSLRLGGDLDLGAVPSFQRELGRLHAARASSLVLDLRGLEFIDLSGLRAVLGTYGGSRWGWVLLVGARPAVRRLFTLLGLGYLLTPDPGLDDSASGAVGDPVSSAPPTAAVTPATVRHRPQPQSPAG
jgi:anti-anti-sigma factor